MRDSFTFKEEYWESLKMLPEEHRVKMTKAIMDYAFNDVIPELSGTEGALFLMIKSMIDADEEKAKEVAVLQKKLEEEKARFSEYGKRGGRPKKNPFFENENPIKTPFSEEKTPLKPPFNPLLEEKENPLDEKEGEKERSKEKSQERDYISQEKELPPYIPPSEGDLGEGENVMAAFFKEFPSVQIDIRSPGETSGVDFAVLAEKLRESPYLRSRYSLRWLIRNYPDIQRDFWRNAPAPMPYAFPPNNEEEERKRRLREIDERLKGVNLNADPGF